MKCSTDETQFSNLAYCQLVEMVGKKFHKVWLASIQHISHFAFLQWGYPPVAETMLFMLKNSSLRLDFTQN
jgi:hypothetical protein